MFPKPIDGGIRPGAWIHFWVMVLLMPLLTAIGFMLSFGGSIDGPGAMLALAVPAYGLGAVPAVLVARLHGRLAAEGSGQWRRLTLCITTAVAIPFVLLAALYASGLIHGVWPLSMLPVVASAVALSALAADWLSGGTGRSGKPPEINEGT